MNGAKITGKHVFSSFCVTKRCETSSFTGKRSDQSYRNFSEFQISRTKEAAMIQFVAIYSTASRGLAVKKWRESSAPIWIYKRAKSGVPVPSVLCVAIAWQGKTRMMPLQICTISFDSTIKGSITMTRTFAFFYVFFHVKDFLIKVRCVIKVRDFTCVPGYFVWITPVMVPHVDNCPTSRGRWIL